MWEYFVQNNNKIWGSLNGKKTLFKIKEVIVRICVAGDSDLFTTGQFVGFCGK